MDRMLERLLRWAVGDSEAAEGLLGDLIEEHFPGGARKWRYRVALLGVVRRYAPSRLAERGSGDLLREVRFALRSLTRAPSFAVVTVATLALGIGGTGAVFSVLRAVVLEPLAYAEADRLVRLESAVPGMDPDARWHLAKAQYRHLRANASSLDQIGLYAFNVTTIGADGGARAAQRARTAMVDPHLFRTLSVTLPLGRAFTEQESLNRAPVVILTDGYWQRAYGRDRTVMGTTVALDGTAHEIVGVLPPGFQLPEEASNPSDPVDLWVPLAVDPSEAASNNHVYRSIGRLAPAADVGVANAELLRLSARLPDVFPEAYSAGFMEEFGFHAVATPLKEDVVGTMSNTLWIVFGSVGLLLLVACFNTANLVLARAHRRRRELAIRSTLGAGTAALLGQLMMESLVLATAAGATALALAAWATRALVTLAPPGIPRLHEVSLDLPSVVFMLAISLGAGVVFGLLPARRVARTDVLGGTGRGLTASRAQHRVRRALVVGQLAVSLVLLSGASLLWQSFSNLAAVDTGMEAESVLTFRVILPNDTYGSYEAAGDFYRQASEQLAELPGVGHVGTTTALPLAGFDGCAAVFLEGEEISASGSPPCVPVIMVGPGYFEAMGIPVRGSTTTWADIGERRVTAVVSEAFAVRFWPGEDAIGRGVSGRGAPIASVAGVVGDVRGAGLDEPAWEALYLSFLPAAGTGSWAVPRFLNFVVQTEGVAPGALIEPIRAVLGGVDPAVPVVDIRPMSDIIAESTARTSFTALLLATASLLALLLSALGVYSVISYIVQGRRSEIGIRLALGAKKSELQRVIVTQSVLMAMVGVSVGLTAAIPLTRVLRSMLFEISPADPVTLGAVSVTLVLIAAGAALAPSLRATRVDPVEALRAE